MPRRDGTGPMGFGPMSGRGLGLCSGVNMVGRGVGLGLGLWAAKRGLRNKAIHRGAGMGMGLCRGMGYGFRGGFLEDPTYEAYSAQNHKERLEEEKRLLERRLNILNKQLKSYSEGEE